MKIGRIYFPVRTLGYGDRVGIWTTGCLLNCTNCISPELQNINAGVELTVDYILDIILNTDKIVDGVTISGGEPFLQKQELKELVHRLINLGIDDILIFTGYTYEELKVIDPRREIIDYAACLITGRYIDTLNNGIGIRGSTNQEIIINKYNERYDGCENCERKVQTILKYEKIISIGIP